MLVSTIPQYLDETGGLAALIQQGRHLAIGPEALAGFAQVPSLIGGGSRLEGPAHLGLGRPVFPVFRYKDYRGRLPEHFRLGPAECILGAAIPSRDLAIKVHRQDRVVCRAVEDLPAPGLLGAHSGVHHHPVGDVRTFCKDADDLSVFTRQGLVDEIEEALANRPVRGRLQRKPGGCRRIGLTRVEHLVQQVEIALAYRLGKRLGDGLADHVAISDQVHVSRICEFDPVLGPCQQRHEARSLLEHAAHPVLLALEPSLCTNLLGCLRHDRDDSARYAHGVEHRRII